VRIPVRMVQPGRTRGWVHLVGAPVDLPAILASSSGGSIWHSPSGRMRSAGEPEEPLPAGGVALAAPVPSLARAPPGPVVCEVPDGLLREDDPIELDADLGTLDLPSVQEVPVVTCFLERADGRILLLRRSEKVGSFQGRWAAVSGYLESEDPFARALTEIREETSIDQSAVELARRGAKLYARDRDRVYAIEPFRFRVPDPRVTLDWEHTESRWILPEELPQFETVPRLEEAWLRVAGPAPRPVDREGRSEAI
jgi:8-oxo-dGTP diphosphatase